MERKCKISDWLSCAKNPLNALCCMIFFIASSCWSSTWHGVPGIPDSTGTHDYCPVSYSQPVNVNATHQAYTPICDMTIADGSAVPASDQYRVVMFGLDNPDGDASGVTHGGIPTTRLYISKDVQLSTLSLNFTMDYAPLDNDSYKYVCYALQSTSYKSYAIPSSPVGCQKVSGGGVLPPGPNYATCVFNNGNAIEVSLGEVARNELGAVPGTLPGIKKDINVNCTGEGSASYSIQFNYTSTNISGEDLVVTSTNGLAVAMSLGDELVNNTKTYTRTYNVGTQTESLKFEPVRDPTVKMTDIATGAFTASAVMIVTHD